MGKGSPEVWDPQPRLRAAAAAEEEVEAVEAEDPAARGGRSTRPKDGEAAAPHPALRGPSATAALPGRRTDLNGARSHQSLPARPGSRPAPAACSPFHWPPALNFKPCRPAP